ncbi:hypothetical protein GJ496_005740 [Pomphorhynchus laevis]|nr:hypothetical protein GJ496_005740 [Pomphorhynchus laevis]
MTEDNTEKSVSSFESSIKLLKDELSVQLTDRDANRIIKAIRKIAPIEIKDATNCIISKCCESLKSNPSNKYQAICDLIQSIYNIEMMVQPEKFKSFEIPLNTDSIRHNDLLIKGNQQLDNQHELLPLDNEKHVLNIKLQRLHYLLVEIKDRIKKLDESELTIEDLDSPHSPYVLQSKLEKRAIIVCKHINKLNAKLKKIQPDAAAQLHSYSLNGMFNCRISCYPLIDREICAMVMQQNRQHVSHSRPSASSNHSKRRKDNSLYFPDYYDVRSLILNLLLTNEVVRREANDLVINVDDNNFSINETLLNQVSRRVFTKLGKILKSHRQHQLHESLLARVPDEFDYSNDPAVIEPNLKEILDKNQKESVERINKIVNYYAEISSSSGLEFNEDNKPITDIFTSKLDDNQSCKFKHTVFDRPSVSNERETKMINSSNEESKLMCRLDSYVSTFGHTQSDTFVFSNQQTDQSHSPKNINLLSDIKQSENILFESKAGESSDCIILD